MNMKVITTQQAGSETPVEIVWANDTDEVGAMLSVAQLMQHAKSDAPWSPKVLDIRIEF